MQAFGSVGTLTQRQELFRAYFDYGMQQAKLLGYIDRSFQQTTVYKQIVFQLQQQNHFRQIQQLINLQQYEVQKDSFPFIPERIPEAHSSQPVFEHPGHIQHQPRTHVVSYSDGKFHIRPGSTDAAIHPQPMSSTHGFEHQDQDQVAQPEAY